MNIGRVARATSRVKSWNDTSRSRGYHDSVLQGDSSDGQLLEQLRQVIIGLGGGARSRLLGRGEVADTLGCFILDQRNWTGSVGLQLLGFVHDVYKRNRRNGKCAQETTIEQIL